MKKLTTKIDDKRIWELDLLKGIAFIFMVWDHIVFDLAAFFGVDTTPLGIFKEGIGYVAAFLFMLICGISVTLGNHNIRHGLITFGLGIALTVGTYVAELIIDDKLIIAFGILHFLGFAMIIGHFVKKLPTAIIVILSAFCFGLGIWFRRMTVSSPFLFPFGLCAESFYSSDYFPLFPNLFYIFAGIVLGKTVYKDKQSIVPLKFKPKRSLLCLAGRHTLFLYFAHQPVVMALLILIFAIMGKPLTLW